MNNKILLLTSVLLASSLTGCGRDTYLIKFDSECGIEIPTQVVRHNGKIKNPGDLERDNHNFLYWSYKGEKWNFSNKVTSNMTISAIWERYGYNISYETTPGFEGLVTFDGAGNHNFGEKFYAGVNESADDFAYVTSISSSDSSGGRIMDFTHNKNDHYYIIECDYAEKCYKKFYNSDGNLTLESDYYKFDSEFNGYNRIEYSYNADGKLISKKEYENNKVKYFYTYNYTDSNVITKCGSTDGGDEYYNLTEYLDTHNEVNRIFCDFKGYDDGAIQFDISTNIDLTGKVTSSTYYTITPNELLTYTEEYIYSSTTGKRIRTNQNIVTYKENYSWSDSKYIEIEYSEDGKLQCETTYRSDDLKIRRKYYVYLNDTLSRVSDEYRIVDGISINWLTDNYYYHYDNEGEIDYILMLGYDKQQFPRQFIKTFYVREK